MTTPPVIPGVAGRDTIGQELHQGRMATVSLAHDLKHDRQVAIKVLRPEFHTVIGAERLLSWIKTAAPVLRLP